MSSERKISYDEYSKLEQRYTDLISQLTKIYNKEINWETNDNAQAGRFLRQLLKEHSEWAVNNVM